MIIFSLKELPVVRESIDASGKLSYIELLELIRTTSMVPEKAEIADLLFKQAEGKTGKELLSGVKLKVEFLVVSDNGDKPEAMTYMVDTSVVLEKLMTSARVPLPLALNKLCESPKLVTFGEGRLVGVAENALLVSAGSVQRMREEKEAGEKEVKVPVYLPAWVNKWVQEQPKSASELVREALIGYYELEQDRKD